MKNTKYVKVLPALVLVVCLVFSLAACGSSGDTENSTEAAGAETESEEEPETETEVVPEPEAEEKTEEETAEETGEEPGSDSGVEPAAVESDLACPSASGQLQVIGTQLCDENGDPIQLRGVSTHGLAWFPEYVNQDCVDELKSWGANLLRLAMYTAESGGYCTDGDPKELKDLIRAGVDYATNADMYVIVDWHILSEGTPTTYQAQAEEFFDEMSKEFADHDNVLYEICNEPNTADWPEIKAYAEDIIPIIRANDPDAIIIVGTPTWSQEVDKPAADPITDYDNIMYTLHFYAATHKDDLRAKMVEAIGDGLPIFVTEYGICDASGNGALDIDSANEWVSLMNEYDVSYAVWNLSNKDESSSILSSDVTKTSGFTYDDLSESGKWLYDMLQGALSGTSVEEATAGAAEEANEANAGFETDDGLTVHAVLDDTWDDGAGTYSYLYRLTVDNTTGNAISQWNLTLTFSEDVTLTDSWNGTCSVNGSTVTISNADYNGALGDGESASDIGFIVEGSSDLTLQDEGKNG